MSTKKPAKIVTSVYHTEDNTIQLIKGDIQVDGEMFVLDDTDINNVEFFAGIKIYEENMREHFGDVFELSFEHTPCGEYFVE